VQNLLSSNFLSKNLKIKIYRTIILLVVYGCETWSQTLREEGMMMDLVNRLLRIFGPKRDEVTSGWRKICNEALNDIYCTPKIVWVLKSRRMRWAGYVAHMVEGRGLCRILLGNPGGKSPLGRPIRRWEDSIKMDP
jgi:hypothetical protein